MTEPILIQLQRYVRDLLVHPEQYVKAGRQNFNRQEFEQPYIVVDSLSGDVPLSSSADYEGDTEKMRYTELVSRSFTFDFYGPTAATLCSNFRLLSRGEPSLDLQRELNITVFHPRAATNVKQLTGQQYGERMQLECQVHYSPSLIVDILRIDIAQLRIIGERGLIYEQ